MSGFQKAKLGDHISFEDIDNTVTRSGKIVKHLGGPRFQVLIDNTLDHVRVDQLDANWFVAERKKPVAEPEAEAPSEPAKPEGEGQ